MTASRWLEQFPGLLALALVLLIIGLSAMVIAPFTVAIAWSCLIAYLTWPLHARVRRALGARPGACAALSTALVIGAIVVPLSWLLVTLAHELGDAFGEMFPVPSSSTGETQGVSPGSVSSLSAWVEELLRPYAQDRAALLRLVLDFLQRWRSELLAVAGGFGRRLGELLTMSFTLYFLFRDSESLIARLRRVRQRYLGPLALRCLRTAGEILHAVMYGFLVTAAVQGAIAGLGYWIFGLRGAVLLGVITGAASILPFIGTGLVWGPAALWLGISGHTTAAILLALWGALLVHPTDNLLRPLLISSATQVPFLVIVFGVFGGLATFGIIGVFVGPVVLGVATELWNVFSAPDPVSPGEPPPT